MFSWWELRQNTEGKKKKDYIERDHKTLVMMRKPSNIMEVVRTCQQRVLTAKREHLKKKQFTNPFHSAQFASSRGIHEKISASLIAA